MEKYLLKLDYLKSLAGNNIKIVDEKTLLHVAWKNWRKIRKYVYRKFKISNMEDLIKSIVIKKIKKEDLMELLKTVVEVTIDDYNEVKEMEKKNISIISVFDKNYPEELLNMKEITENIYPPLILYHRGALKNLNEAPCIAVVGTRKCSDNGFLMAKNIGKLIAEMKFILVTGFAKGIDTGATQGAIEANGKVIEVRPWLDPIGPAYNRDLIPKILKNGCFIAENFKMMNSPTWIRMQYQLRNRIISGISKLVIIVEARPKGGSMHQVEYALKRKKPVLIWEPQNNAEFKEAYRIYISQGAKSFKTLEELEELIKQYIS